MCHLYPKGSLRRILTKPRRFRTYVKSYSWRKTHLAKKRQAATHRLPKDWQNAAPKDVTKVFPRSYLDHLTAWPRYLSPFTLCHSHKRHPSFTFHMVRACVYKKSLPTTEKKKSTCHTKFDYNDPIILASSFIFSIRSSRIFFLYFHPPLPLPLSPTRPHLALSIFFSSFPIFFHLYLCLLYSEFHLVVCLFPFVNTVSVRLPVCVHVSPLKLLHPLTILLPRVNV